MAMELELELELEPEPEPQLKIGDWEGIRWLPRQVWTFGWPEKRVAILHEDGQVSQSRWVRNSLGNIVPDLPLIGTARASASASASAKVIAKVGNLAQLT
ncbi:hypothetical protein ACMFMF_007395 [Clarireedia jacksonii]